MHFRLTLSFFFLTSLPVMAVTESVVMETKEKYAQSKQPQVKRRSVQENVVVSKLTDGDTENCL